MAVFSAGRVLFPHLDDSRASKPTPLPFWLQPFRDSLAVSTITQFNQQLSFVHPFYSFPLAPGHIIPCSFGYFQGLHSANFIAYF
ncbi:MAG: hypothetical protein F6K23_14040 [Okeania sp. SIO2C9]|uniref:hypothetical protein n=1 Tax=Okeania sp. SIO2C9 TaxID=2607791 RepID=UPI0013C23E73|nr:hypothetical protein [Okeania sp. SIO2C9]NEQ74063.1 hypothetical protein [Okeania sp. SIO2C9]